jgi:Uncharacterised nucleotidyltransferase
MDDRSLLSTCPNPGMQLELHLLILCLAARSQPEALTTIPPLIQQGVDWKQFLEQATVHKVLPLAAQTLIQVDPSLIPDQIAERLSALVDSATLYTLGLTAELVHLLSYLNAKGISVVSFKGPTLSQLAYGDLILRMSSDLDLLLHDQDFLKPKALLKDTGYLAECETFLTSEGELAYHRMMGEYSMIHQEKGIEIDIHVRLAAIHPFVFGADFSPMWQRLQTVSLLGKPVQTLCPEDMLLYLCVHNSRDRWQYLYAVCDVDGLVRRHPNLDWQQVLNEADRLGMQRMLLLGLALTQRFLGTPLPMLFERIIEGDQAVQILVEKVIAFFVKGRTPGDKGQLFERFWFYLAIMDRGSDKLNYCVHLPLHQLRLFFMINSKDYTFLKLPRPVHFLYYGVRPVRLLKEYGLGVFKLIFP